MGSLEAVIHLGRGTGERQRLVTEKREKVAERIADRHLSRIKAEKYAGVVRGTRFGFGHTRHDTEVYELVAQRLIEHDIEIKVHEISQVAHGDPDNVRHPVMHVLSLATLAGFPRYIAQTPTAHPLAYTNGIGPIPGARLVVEQIYPPQPPDSPTT